MNELDALLADALALADTGAFSNAAKMRAALLLLSRDAWATDDLLSQADLCNCLDARCARAVAGVRAAERAERTPA